MYWWTILFLAGLVIRGMAPVPSVQEKMEEWTGEEEKIGEYPKHMRSVFREEEKS